MLLYLFLSPFWLLCLGSRPPHDKKLDELTGSSVSCTILPVFWASQSRGGCSKVTGGSGLIIITSGRGSNSRYYMVPRLVHAKMGNFRGSG